MSAPDSGPFVVFGSHTWFWSAVVRKRFSESCVGTVFPGLVSVSKPNAPPALVDVLLRRVRFVVAALEEGEHARVVAQPRRDRGGLVGRVGLDVRAPAARILLPLVAALPA